jgi:membrane protein
MIASVLSVVTLLIGATSIFAELQSDLDRIWRAPVAARPSGLWGLLRTRLLSFGLIVSIGFLLLVSLVVSGGLAEFGSWYGAWFPGWVITLQVLNQILTLAFMTALFALMYRILPSVRVAGRVARRLRRGQSPGLLHVCRCSRAGHLVEAALPSSTTFATYSATPKITCCQP